MRRGERNDCCDREPITKSNLSRIYVGRYRRVLVVRIWEWWGARGAVDGSTGGVIEHGRHLGKAASDYFTNKRHDGRQRPAYQLESSRRSDAELLAHQGSLSCPDIYDYKVLSSTVQ